MDHQLFWGDLHSHCAISYGHGSVEQALARARQQLDFCSVTGHAFWPDMPTDRSQYAQIIDYHRAGFATLAGNWGRLIELERQGSQEGTFLALPSYEWHSLKFGDHNLYAPGPELPLRDAPDLPALREVIRARDGIAIPHHIGYKAGYRGINWAHFKEDVSPFVEIFSLHGCSLSEHAPYPMYHDMGPRDAGSTAQAGWAMGHRFGIVGGTDHHAAYPGSHGDGRMGVFAPSLTREALFEAFKARRVYAATGDKIDARLFINDAWIGETIHAPAARQLRIAVQGMHRIDQVRLIKNGRPLRYFHPKPGEPVNPSRPQRFRLRVTWGWGKNTQRHTWEGRLGVREGALLEVEPCFSGQAVVAPKQGTSSGEPDPDLPHELLDVDAHHCSWRSVTSGNLTMRHGTTQGLSLLIDASDSTSIDLNVNGQRFTYRLADLVNAGRTEFMHGWLSSAIRVGPAMPLGDCCVNEQLSDEPELDVDRYRLEVRQTNNQWAWLTPIWVER